MFWREDACLNISCSLTPWKTGRYHLTEGKIELSDFNLHIFTQQLEKTTFLKEDIERWWDVSAECNGAKSKDIPIVPEASQITPNLRPNPFQAISCKRYLLQNCKGFC